MNSEVKIMEECRLFKDYTGIEEYVDDLIICLKTFCRYSEEEARSFIKTEDELVKRMYDAKYPAYNLAMDYYPICG